MLIAWGKHTIDVSVVELVVVSDISSRSHPPLSVYVQFTVTKALNEYKATLFISV